MFILSGAFLAAIAVMALIIAVDSGGDDSGSKQPTPTAQPSSSGGQAAPGAPGCAPTDTSQQIPASAPSGVSWQVYKGMVMPVSAAAGPLVVNGDVARCYARTPTGALIAATQIGFRYAVADNWRAVAAQLIDGPGKTVWRQNRSASPHPSAPQQGEVGQIAGYRFLTYSPDVAVIQLAYRNSIRNSDLPSFFAGSYSLRWQGGDWRLQLQPSGTASIEAPNTESLDGYTPWGGV